MSDAGCAPVAVESRDLRDVRVADRDTAPAASGPAVIGTKDRGKSYWRQVGETVWVAAVFGGGIWLGAMMAGAK